MTDHEQQAKDAWIKTIQELERENMEMRMVIERLPLGKCHDIDFYDIDGDAECRKNCPACRAIRILDKVKGM